MRGFEEFADKLNRTKISSTCTIEESTELIRQLNETVPTYPDKLFKYRQCDELSINSFINNKIWIPKSSNFNDPHDTLLYFNSFLVNKVISSLITPDQITEIKNQISLYDLTCSESSESYLANYDPALISIFRSLDLDSLISLFRTIADNNIKEMGSVLDDVKRSFKNSTYVSCFSSDINSNLMWAHYAGSSTGFALEYNFLDGIYDDIHDSHTFNTIDRPVIYPVIYSNKRFDATDYAYDLLVANIFNTNKQPRPFEITDTLTHFKCALHKSVDWKYEQEWRLISIKKDMTTAAPSGICITKKPTALYLGSNISETYKKIMMNLAMEKNIPVYQMFLDDASEKFRLDYMKVI